MVLLLMVTDIQAQLKEGHFFKTFDNGSVTLENAEQYFGQWFSLPAGTEWKLVSQCKDIADMDRIGFPSGHTNLGWTTALMMVEVAPDHQDEILRRGYQYGYNRLIVGYHWATDIEATRMLSSALVARLHADPQVQQLIANAVAEYNQLVTGINSVTHTETTSASSRIYRLDGTPGDITTNGIVIVKGKKILIK